MANFYYRFLQSAERWPDLIAVEIQRHGGPVERLTYSQLRTMAESLGRWLLASGLDRGTRCAILAGNGPRWIAAYLGTVAAGMVAVPLDTAFNTEQVAKLLRASGSSLLLVDAKHLHLAQRAVADDAIRLVLLEPVESPVAGPDLDAILKLGPDGFTPVDVPGDETAAILYTSGTTSDPKGVMLTHDNFQAETEGVFRLLDITPRDAILGVLPLFHALAQMANLLLPLAGGARIVFLESLNTAELLRALRERDITLFCCVPQFFYLIHERIRKEAGARGRLAETVFRWMLQISRVLRSLGLNLGKLLFRPVHAMLGPKMRYLISGGSKLDPGIARDFHAMGFELLQAYGLTETTGGAIGTPPNDNVIGSVGKPLHGMELKLRDPKAPEDAAGPAVGEILLRGPLVMKGYCARPEATAEVMRDGWLHTGDLGYLDAHGNVFITGREKEVIVLSNGKNIYPEEIEAHYLKSPFIKEICVLGLQGRPGEPFAERLHAVIVPNFEVLRERKIVNTREIIRFDLETLSAQLSSTKRILGFDIWQEDLPRTTTRKIKRFEVERRVKEKQAAAQVEGEELARTLTEDERQWLANPDVARAVAVITRAADGARRQLHPRDNLELDLGLDSMERVELLVALERELGASVPDAVVSEVYTVRELVDVVRQSVGRGGRVQERAAWDSILNTDPTDPEVLAVARRKPVTERAWFLFGRLFQLFVRDRFGLTVTGVEKLPRHGPFIISPNHQSFLDPPVLVSMLPYSILRDAFYVGTSEIFGNGILRALARSLKLIPVDPDANLVPAMRAGAYGLRHGKVLILYPEGERSIDGAPKVFKKGAAILATHLKVPIYPVAMDGFFEAWPRGKGFQKFTHLHVAFGDPIYPPQQVDNPERTYELLTAELKARVMAMWLEMRERGQRQAAD
jgi:long-chain acyl-CoA synthetase